MKKTINWSLLISILTFFACQDDDVMTNSESEGSELVSVRAEIGGADTRAAATKNVDYIGREKFAGNDVMVLTHIKRTEKPLASFSYEKVRYVCNQNLAWSRSIQDGFCEQERIYWTDNASYHTFKGYSVPQAWASSIAEKWNETDGTFTGQFDYRKDSNEKTYVDFRSQFSDMKDELLTNSQGVKVPTGHLVDSTGTRLRNEDVLIVCNTEQLIDKGGMTTTLRYRHALASLRVIIDINGFAPTSTSEDAKTMVSNLVVLNQPWKYKWTQEPFDLCAADNNGALQNPGWGVQDNMGETDAKIDSVFTWQPRPDGEGTGKAKKFTFYSLIVPGQQTNFTMNYRVTYPMYNNPDENWTKTYQAVVPTVNFLPGYTTTLLISLNHKGEPIYIGANYVDWEYVETPDRGELQKISTFLDVNVRDKDGKKVVSIAMDSEATKDDATWLYYLEGDKTNEANIRDIYGNDGSENKPFIIKTARQFMSFAYEVKEGLTTRGRTFEGKYIKLDSDICLQKSTVIPASDTITWNGIGDASNPFKGTFDAGFRIIKGLKGKPLFANNAGTILFLYLEDIIGIKDGNAAFVETNSGNLIGCSVGSRKFDDPNYTILGDGTNIYFGSLCSVNSGTITACYSTSSFVVKKASATIGGLVGNNTGTIQVSYAASHVDATSPTAVNGVAGANSKTISDSYFDKDQNKLVDVLSGDVDACGAKALTTLQLQDEYQVRMLNDQLTNLNVTTYRFYYRTAAYPVLDYGNPNK